MSLFSKAEEKLTYSDPDSTYLESGAEEYSLVLTAENAADEITH
jgi:hypothetical protein